MLGFSSIYYDRFNNKINFWYYDDNRNKKHIVKEYTHFYYEPVKYETDLKDTNGNYVERREVESLQLMESIKKSQKNLSESDLSPEVKFLQEVLHGNRFKADSTLINTAYIDIEVAGENEFPYPEFAKYPINLITVKSSKTGQVYTFGTQEYTNKNSEYVQNYYWNESEEVMLETFAKWFRKQNFDVITGWNSEGFDLPYMHNRYKNLDILDSFKLLSPIKKVYYSERKGTVSIAGLNHLDYMLLFKNFTFENQPSYSLQYIGVIVTGEGKLELDGALNHIYKTNWNQFVDYNIQDVLLVEKIDKKKRFIELAFNFAYQACIPPERVYSSITLIEGYLLGYQHDSGTVMPDRKELAPDWWIEGEYYKVNGTLQNYPEGDDDDKFGPYYVKGGYVMAKPGKKHIGMSFDVTSEYPHMVMQYNISPETKVILPSESEKKHLIESEINGVYYKKHSDLHGVLPRWIKKMFDERAYFKKLMFVAEGLGKGFTIEKIAELNKLSLEKAQEFINEVLLDFPNQDFNTAYNYYDSQQHIRKILINSAYGAMANEWFHYYDVDNARAVTRGGRVCIRYLAHSANEYMKSQEFCNWLNNAFNTNVNIKELQAVDSLRLIDTDSNYYSLAHIYDAVKTDMTVLDFCYKIESHIEEFFDNILREFAESKGMPHVIDFKRECIFDTMIILAKKKYLMNIRQKEAELYEKPKLKITGFEIKKSSTPKFSKLRIEAIIKNIFEKDSYEENIAMIRSAWKEYKDQPLDMIAQIGGVNEYTKYAHPTEWYLKNGLSYMPRTPSRNRGAINHNYLVRKMNLPIAEISNGSKVKYVAVYPTNPIKQDIIAWSGNWPKQFDELGFKIDYEKQFEDTFTRVLERVYTVIGWGKKIVYKQTAFSKFSKKKEGS